MQVRVSHKSVLQRVSSKSALQESCATVSCKGVVPECHLSASSQGVPQICSPENVLSNFNLCPLTSVSAFGFVGFIFSALGGELETQGWFSRRRMRRCLSFLRCHLLSPDHLRDHHHGAQQSHLPEPYCASSNHWNSRLTSNCLLSFQRQVSKTLKKIRVLFVSARVFMMLGALSLAEALRMLQPEPRVKNEMRRIAMRNW